MPQWFKENGFYTTGAGKPVENPPLATKNLLEVTDGLRRPP